MTSEQTCGFVAVVNTDRSALDRDLLEGLAEANPRSPCAPRLWWQDNVGLGQVGPEAAAEIGEGDPVRVVAGARIDARGLLGDDLGSREAVAGISSAEAIAAAYRAWDVEAPAHLLGDFALAVWDSDRGRLLCARDQLGVEPLYFAETGRTLIVSNALESILAHPLVDDGIDPVAARDFMFAGVASDPQRTVYRGIRRVPAAHVLIWSSGGRAELRRYWRLEDPGYPEDDPDDAVEQFAELVSEATRDRADAGGTAVMLSGGLDSPLVAATARDAVGAGTVHGHTIIPGALMEDAEGELARLAGTALGIGVELHDAGRYELFAGWERPDWRPAQPISDPTALVTVDLLRDAGRTCGAVLTGYDGDALLQTWPAGHFLNLLGRGALGRFTADARRYVREQGAPPPLGLRAALSRGRPHRGQAPVWIDGPHPARGERPPIRRSPRADAVELLTARGFADTVETFDLAVTRSGVPVRHPLLDLRVIEFAMRLAPIRWTVDKRLIRMACAQVLPPAIHARPKAPLRVDPAWLRIVRAGREAQRPAIASDAVGELVRSDRMPTYGEAYEAGVLWPLIWTVELDRWALGTGFSGR